MSRESYDIRHETLRVASAILTVKGDNDMNNKFTRYASLDAAQRSAIVEEYRTAKQQTSTNHAVAIAAHRALCNRNDRTWNSKTGSDAFAATLATLVMRGEIVLADRSE